MSWRERLSQRFPNIARHFLILRESWRRQEEADRLARPRSEYQAA